MNDINIKILILLLQDTFVLEDISMYLNLEMNENKYII